MPGFFRSSLSSCGCKGMVSGFLCFVRCEWKCFVFPIDRAPLHVSDVGKTGAGEIAEQNRAFPIAFCGLHELRYLRRRERVAFF